MVFSKFFDEATSTQKQIASLDDDKPTQNKPAKKKKKKKKSSAKNKETNAKDSKSKSTDAAGKQLQANELKSRNKSDKNPPNNKSQNRKRRRHDRDDRQDGRRKHHRKEKPSPEALELSRQLMDLSRRKNLEDTLKLYWDESNNALRDAHHACIVVDCCARCGDISRAQAVLDTIPKKDITIELQTALIKGYAHSGDMHKAMTIFKSLYSAGKETRNLTPNVRTLNTLLRGCLWTASTEIPDAGLAGGVVSSEEAWNLHKKSCGELAPPDTSSFEASITLLCQAFRIKETVARIEEFQMQFNVHFKGKASIKIGDADQSVLETLAAAYLCLGRVYAMLRDHDNLWQSAQRSLRSIEASRRLLVELKAQATTHGKTNEKKDYTRGGKRGWKREGEEEKTDRRNASNLTYRDHRLNEMEAEVKGLLKLRTRTEGQLSPSEAAEKLSSHIASKLFYFGGGGTTELTQQATGNPRKVEVPLCSPETLFSPKWVSFGLKELAGMISTPQSSSSLSEKEKHTEFFDSSGRLKPASIFGQDLSNAPFDIELGAGFGDWIVRQAECHQQRNHMAVELRSDRVYQILSRSVLGGNKQLQNLCVVGSEAGSFLRDRVQPKSVSNLFVNFPEPPTQTFGDNPIELEKVESGKMEPAHMLCFSTMKLAFQCLVPGGRIIVVTDNKWYARLVCVTCCRLARQVKGVQPVKPSELRGLREIEKFDKGIRLLQGQPNKSIGHAEIEGGGSYFDRLWRTGASNYAQKTTRFVVVISRK